MMLVIVLMGMVTATANASLWVTWAASGGFTLDGASPLLGSDGSGLQYLVQLIWSADATLDTQTTDDSGAHYLSGEGDVWLTDFTFTAGSQWGDFGFGSAPTVDLPTGYTNGFIYSRAFVDNTPIAGERYIIGPSIANQNKASTNAPAGQQQYEVNHDTALGDAMDGPWSGVIVAVPEPATLTLFGLGVLAIGGRRFRRNRGK